MSPHTFKRLSLFAAIMSGLIPAVLLVFGTERLFGMPQLFRTIHATAVGAAPSTPTDAFIIGFSETVQSGSLEGKISVFPETPFEVQWNDDHNRISIKPVGRWATGGRYRVFIASARSGLTRTVPESSFSFRIPDYPGILSMTPADGTSDVSLDIEDPIVVYLDRSAKDFFIDLRLAPDVAVTYGNDADKTEFRVLPQGAAKPDTRYTLSVHAKWKNEPDGAYRKIGETSFTTRAERPTDWAKDIVARAEQAKRYAHASITTGKYIDIDRSIQVMTIFQDGVALDAYPISTGKSGMETPEGQFQIRNKADKPWSAAYGLYMPYWMALVPDGKFGIHELPEWPGGYKEGANHLGIPVSHGCVRLGVGAAKRVYEWAEIGMSVIVR
ncbi:MAG TPA: L,D-transpeptidase family protein [Candidatus Fimivivens sp.]|nr:L,D-transpeptidase family protein [Candidatus Fimivivens sp.]